MNKKIRLMKDALLLAVLMVGAEVYSGFVSHNLTESMIFMGIALVLSIGMIFICLINIAYLRGRIDAYAELQKLL